MSNGRATRVRDRNITDTRVARASKPERGAATSRSLITSRSEHVVEPPCAAHRQILASVVTWRTSTRRCTDKLFGPTILFRIIANAAVRGTATLHHFSVGSRSVEYV